MPFKWPNTLCGLGYLLVCRVQVYESRTPLQLELVVLGINMDERFQDYSWIQDFEADFPKKVSLKILNIADSNSFFDLFAVYLKTIDHLNLKLLIFLGIVQVLRFDCKKIRILEMGMCIKGLYWPPLEPKTSPNSFDWFIRMIASVKVWHLFHFYCCYGNKNGWQNRPKIEKLPFWTKCKAFGDRILKN